MIRGGFRDRAAKAKNKLSTQHQKSYDSKDDKGFVADTVFDEATLKELGVEIWKPEKGDHLIDAVPFLCGSQHPDLPEGSLAHNVDYWGHKLREAQRFFVCQRTFKATDPVCQYIQKHRPEKKEWMKIKPTRYCAYLVWVHDNEKEEAKGIQVWDIAHFFFEKNICAIQKDPKTGQPIVWSSHDKGKHVFFTITQSGSFEDDQGKKRDSVEFGGFQLVDRDEPALPDWILDQSFALDMAMKMHPSEEEVTKAFYGDNDQPTHAQSTEEKEGKKEEKKEKSALERAKERVAQRKAEETEGSEPEPEPEPESEPDPEPEPEPVSDPSDICPAVEIGGEFGVTIEQLAECDECDQWKACKKRYHELKKEKEGAPPKQTTTSEDTTSSRKPKLVRRS